MTIYNFGTVGKERKQLAAALGEILNVEYKYLGTPHYNYQVGNFIIDKRGAVAGNIPTDVLTTLSERGFTAEIETINIIPEPTEIEIQNENDVEEIKTQAENNAPETEVDSKIDRISIDMPLDDFTEMSFNNLSKMVSAKAPLIKMALGVDALPIEVVGNVITFAWFKATDNADVIDYAYFITALCETAKKKKCVTAKAQDAFENPRFSMRVWLTSLGLVGSKYSQIRRLLTANLPGNGAYRFGKPESRAVTKKRDHIQREVLSTPNTRHARKVEQSCR